MAKAMCVVLLFALVFFGWSLFICWGWYDFERERVDQIQQEAVVYGCARWEHDAKTGQKVFRWGTVSEQKGKPDD